MTSTESAVADPRTTSHQIACAWCGAAATSLTGRCDCGGHYETTSPTEIAADGDGFFGRWASQLPIDATAHPVFDLESPLVRVEALSPRSGDPDVYLKLDCQLPTGSTKDRAAAGGLAFLYDNGVRALAMSSTGNTSTAFAHYARYYPDMWVHIFAGRDFAFRVQALGADNVVMHIVDGSFVQAGKEAQRYAEDERICWENGFYNPGRRDGLKTSYLEAITQLGGVRPSMYVQAVSSAMGPIAVEQASRQTSAEGVPDVSLLLVQQASCAPMARTWFADLEKVPDDFKIKKPQGICKAILRGDPTDVYPSVRRALKATDGDMAVVDESQIRAAQQLVWDEAGISVCESSAAAVAAWLAYGPSRRAAPTGRPVVINVAGQDRNEIHR